MYLVQFKNKRGVEVLQIASNEKKLEKILARNWRIRATAQVFEVGAARRARALAIDGLWMLEEGEKDGCRIRDEKAHRS